jgi:hypothetical protein
MHIDRTTLDDAQNDPGPGGAGVIDMINKALANGDPVIIREVDGSESLLQLGGPGKGDYRRRPSPGSEPQTPN